MALVRAKADSARDVGLRGKHASFDEFALWREVEAVVEDAAPALGDELIPVEPRASANLTKSRT